MTETLAEHVTFEPSKCFHEKAKDLRCVTVLLCCLQTTPVNFGTSLIQFPPVRLLI